MADRIWKALDTAGLLLIAAMLATFTCMMGWLLWQDVSFMGDGGSLQLGILALAIVHVVIGLAAATFGALLAVAWRLIK